MAEIQYVDLLRHGESVLSGRFCGSSDAPLTETGAMAALRLARSLGPWDLICTSPLQRCQQTAQQLAEDSGVLLRADARWQEIHFGVWEGCSAEELQASQGEALAAFWQDPEKHPPSQGESLSQFESRVQRVWNDLLAQRAPRSLVVAHAGVIRSILRRVLGLSWTNAQQLLIGPASLTRLRLYRSETHTDILVEFVNRQWMP